MPARAATAGMGRGSREITLLSKQTCTQSPFRAPHFPMSYDLSLLSPGVMRPREFPLFDDPDERLERDISSPAISWDALVQAMESRHPEWIAERCSPENSSIEPLYAWHHPVAGIQIELYRDEGGITLPLREERATAICEALPPLLATIRDTTGAALFDDTIGRVVSWDDAAPDVLNRYREALRIVSAGFEGMATTARQRRTPLFPDVLDRVPYFVRWLIVTATAALLGSAVLDLTLRTRYEPLMLVPAAGWLILKTLLLDPARLRDIGWSPFLTLINFIPPLNLFLQILLFVLSSRRLPPPRLDAPSRKRL